MAISANTTASDAAVNLCCDAAAPAAGVDFDDVGVFVVLSFCNLDCLFGELHFVNFIGIPIIDQTKHKQHHDGPVIANTEKMPPYLPNKRLLYSKCISYRKQDKQ
eukprot:2476979-Ditylum_brightwellii.AAC.1